MSATGTHVAPFEIVGALSLTENESNEYTVSCVGIGNMRPSSASTFPSRGVRLKQVKMKMRRRYETESVPSAKLGDALGELPVLAVMVMMANVAAAVVVAKHTYEFVTGGGKDREPAAPRFVL